MNLKSINSIAFEFKLILKTIFLLERCLKSFNQIINRITKPMDNNLNVTIDKNYNKFQIEIQRAFELLGHFCMKEKNHKIISETVDLSVWRIKETRNGVRKYFKWLN